MPHIEASLNVKMQDRNTFTDRPEGNNKPVDSDLRATLTVMHISKAYFNSKGITFEEFMAQLGGTTSTEREVIFTLYRCKRQGLVDIKDGRYRLTSKGQGYACPDTAGGGYSWVEGRNHRSLVYNLSRDKNLPRSMGER